MNKPKFGGAVSLVLTLALAAASFPVVALGTETDGLCEHHPAHTADCGYAESGVCSHACTQENGCIAVSCGHNHAATCFDAEGALLCSHACTGDPACGQLVTNCLHTEHSNCGHAEGQPCDFAVNGCEQCQEDAEESLTQIKGTDVTIEGYSFQYTGYEICPQITVVVGETLLVENTHYTLTYENNVEVGTGNVTVSGVAESGYEGIVTIPFTIEAVEFTLQEIKGTDVIIDGTEFTYTGEAIEPSVVVTVNGTVLTKDKDYTLTYENNVEPGTASVTVRGIDTASQILGYTGEVTIEFTIVEAEEPGKPEDTEEEDKQESEPVSYKITKGNRATWYQGSDKKLSFTVNGDAEKFTGISVNGKGLEKSYYSVNDNTVTLNVSFLNKLIVGKYAIAIHYADGDAEGTFFVSDKLDTTNPVTGDESNIGLWAAVALTSLSALGAATFVLRRKNGK